MLLEALLPAILRRCNAALWECDCQHLPGTGAFINIMYICRIAAQVFNTVIGKMVTAVLWTSPLGIASLIAAAICRACSLLGTLGALGLWLTTVMAGVALLSFQVTLVTVIPSAVDCRPMYALRMT